MAWNEDFMRNVIVVFGVEEESIDELLGVRACAPGRHGGIELRHLK